MRESDQEREGLVWQTEVWDAIAPVYLSEIDELALPRIEHVISRAALRPGHQVLDLGTGTGAAALHAAPLVAPDGLNPCARATAGGERDSPGYDVATR